jgi:predicted ATPase
MFVDRARRVRPDVALTPENAGAIASICVRLDGLPLALELAAARTRLLPPPALLARLDESTGYGMLDMLADGARDLPARQQTLRDTIAWSYDLLDDGEQHLFRRLAVFAGGCAVDAAIAICAPDDDARSSASILLDQLTSLVDKSLVYQELGPDGEPRCLLLETIRAFALERLIASGEEPELRRRHARYYLAVVEQVGGLLFANRDNRLRTAAEQDNLHEALHWLVLHG